MNTLNFISGIAIPAIIWLLMLVVGLELRFVDFQRVVKLPKAVVIATLGQLLLLPIIAASLIWILNPEPFIVAGIILLAASPGGAISNFYAFLARANVALSVTLTAISSILSMVTMPILIALGFSLFLNHNEAIDVPTLRMAVQLIVMLILPVATGMGLRRWKPLTIERHAQRLRRFSLIVLTILIGIILVDQRHTLTTSFGSIVLAATLFSLIAMGTGWGLARLLVMSKKDSLTMLIEFTARNLAMTAVIGVMVFERTDFVLFATLFFLIQLPLLLIVIGLLSIWSGNTNDKEARIISSHNNSNN